MRGVRKSRSGVLDPKEVDPRSSDGLRNCNLPFPARCVTAGFPVTDCSGRSTHGIRQLRDGQTRCLPMPTNAGTLVCFEAGRLSHGGRQ
jgi:hypothetical protein